jgi:hypothetical protein
VRELYNDWSNQSNEISDWLTTMVGEMNIDDELDKKFSASNKLNESLLKFPKWNEVIDEVVSSVTEATELSYSEYESDKSE